MPSLLSRLFKKRNKNKNGKENKHFGELPSKRREMEKRERNLRKEQRSRSKKSGITPQSGSSDPFGQNEKNNHFNQQQQFDQQQKQPFVNHFPSGNNISSNHSNGMSVSSSQNRRKFMDGTTIATPNGGPMLASPSNFRTRNLFDDLTESMSQGDATMMPPENNIPGLFLQQNNQQQQHMRHNTHSGKDVFAYPPAFSRKQQDFSHQQQNQQTTMFDAIDKFAEPGTAVQNSSTPSALVEPTKSDSTMSYSISTDYDDDEYNSYKKNFANLLPVDNSHQQQENQELNFSNDARRNNNTNNNHQHNIPSLIDGSASASASPPPRGHLHHHQQDNLFIENKSKKNRSAQDIYPDSTDSEYEQSPPISHQQQQNAMITPPNQQLAGENLIALNNRTGSSGSGSSNGLQVASSRKRNVGVKPHTKVSQEMGNGSFVVDSWPKEDINTTEQLNLGSNRGNGTSKRSTNRSVSSASGTKLSKSKQDSSSGSHSHSKKLDKMEKDLKRRQGGSSRKHKSGLASSSSVSSTAKTSQTSSSLRLNGNEEDATNFSNSDDGQPENLNSWLFDQVDGALGPKAPTADMESLSVSGRSHRSCRSHRSGGGRSHVSHKSASGKSRSRRHRGSGASVSSRQSHMSHRSNRSYMSDASRSVANDLLRLEMQLAMVGNAEVADSLIDPDYGSSGTDMLIPRSSGALLDSLATKDTLSTSSSSHHHHSSSRSNGGDSRAFRKSRNSSNRKSRSSSKNHQHRSSSQSSPRNKSHYVPNSSQKTIIAPAGKLGIILANKTDSRGTVVSGVRTSSVLSEKIFPGDRIVAVDGEDVSRMTVSEITSIMARKNDFNRELTVMTSSNHSSVEEHNINSNPPQGSNIHNDMLSPVSGLSGSPKAQFFPDGGGDSDHLQ